MLTSLFHSPHLPQRAADVINQENIGGFDSAGALDIFSDNPLHKESLDGEQVGTVSGRCTLLPNNNTEWFCHGTFKFVNGGDTISFAGLSPNSYDPGRVAITGGTGCYEGASGTLLMTPLAIVDEYDAYQWELESTTADGSTCDPTPLSQLFGGGLVETVTGGEIVGDFETMGSLDLWSGNPITSSDGTQVGTSGGVCTLLPGALAWHCIGQIFINGSNDSITYSGYSPNSLDTGTLAITGGTGCYEGAGGTLLLTAEDESYATYLWGFSEVTNEAKSSCMSLQDAFQGYLNVYEENVAGQLLGDYTTGGSQELWWNHPLHAGTPDGEEVGTSLGSCTLLPNATEFICAGQLMIGTASVGGDSITYSGYSPNSYDGGMISIDGGTGCYDGIGGTFLLSALSVDEEFDYYLYELLGTTEVGDGEGGEGGGGNTDTSLATSTGTSSIAMCLISSISFGIYALIRAL